VSGVEPSFWVRWHLAYEDPTSALSRRLVTVQDRLRAALDAGSGRHPIRLISVCAGQGHDVAGALHGHPRANAVEALLVEADPDNVRAARRRMAEAGLDGVRVAQDDASQMNVYREAVPADVVLLCGVFGNVTGGDVHRTVSNASRLCAPAATVIWTRHREAPDLTPAIRRWFEEAGFEELAFDSPGQDRWAVGTHRLAAPPLPFDPDLSLFTFLERPSLPVREVRAIDHGDPRTHPEREGPPRV
jgi:predicted RNA methylase